MPRALTRRQISANSITIVMAASTRAPAVVVRIAAQSLGSGRSSSSAFWMRRALTAA